MSALDSVRPPVAHFAVAMENVLQTHDQRKGKAGWKELSTEQLKTMIEKQFLEIAAYPPDPEFTAARAVDIGNLAMMLWDISCDQARRQLYGETPP